MLVGPCSRREHQCKERECECRSCLCWLLLIGLLLALLRWLQKQVGGGASPDQTGTVPSQTQPVPPRIYRQPDPFIYDQYYLAKLGYPITWHNPDVRLEDPGTGTVVDSSALEPGTTYDVVARVWNSSTSAPAPHMPVKFSFLSFGIGQTKTEIGTSQANLSVKGGSACPAYARHPWTTPSTPGHYCLQVELIWTDDGNPENNLGQHNTDVKALNSPNADFAFPVRNEADFGRAIRMEVDGYAIPPLPECQPQPEPRDRTGGPQHHDYPQPAGWTVEVNPPELQLGPGEQQTVAVHISAPDGFTGIQAFNVHALASGAPIGGVTLYARS